MLVPDTVVELLPVGETVDAVATFSSMVMGALVELDAFVLVVEAFVVDVVLVEPIVFHRMRKIKCENRNRYKGRIKILRRFFVFQFCL